MSEKKNTLVTQGEIKIDEVALFERVSAIIENRKYRAQAAANSEGTLRRSGALSLTPDP